MKSNTLLMLSLECLASSGKSWSYLGSIFILEILLPSETSLRGARFYGSKLFGVKDWGFFFPRGWFVGFVFWGVVLGLFLRKMGEVM